MKNGLTPIHIQRWAPADYHIDESVKLLKKRRDYRTLTFYRHFIDASFTAGGDLPADPEALAAVVEMPQKDVERALEFCLNRLLFQDGNRLYQPRVRRDVVEELTFRAEQSKRGRLGGRPKKEAIALDKDKPLVVEPKSPPAPAPAPAPQPNEPPPSPQNAGGEQGEFDLPPGMADTGPPGPRHDRKAQAERLEAARLYAIHVGFHPRRHDLREMSRWVKSGRTLPEIQHELDARRAEGATIMQQRPRL